MNRAARPRAIVALLFPVAPAPHRPTLPAIARAFAPAFTGAVLGLGGGLVLVMAIGTVVAGMAR